MLDQVGAELKEGDLVCYTEGKHRFQFGRIYSIGPSLHGDAGSRAAQVALFGDVSDDGRPWHTIVYSSQRLLKLVPPARVDWLLTLMPELSDTHDRAGADRMIQELRAVR